MAVGDLSPRLVCEGLLGLARGASLQGLATTILASGKIPTRKYVVLWQCNLDTASVNTCRSKSFICAYCYCILQQTDEALRGPSRPCQHHPGVLPSSRDGIDSTWPRFQSASCLLRNEINYTLVVHVCPLCDLTKRVPTCVRLQSN